jgi:hypothetical protein
VLRVLWCGNRPQSCSRATGNNYSYHVLIIPKARYNDSTVKEEYPLCPI